MCPTNKEDMTAYEKLVRPLMSDDDYLDPSELISGFNGKPILNWFAVFRGEVIGWAAVTIPSRYVKGHPSLHTIGVAVHADFRNVGIASRLMDYQILLSGGSVLTASIRPGNVSSERLFGSRGFKVVGFTELCRTWQRLR